MATDLSILASEDLADGIPVHGVYLHPPVYLVVVQAFEVRSLCLDEVLNVALGAVRVCALPDGSQPVRVTGRRDRGKCLREHVAIFHGVRLGEVVEEFIHRVSAEFASSCATQSRRSG